MTMGGEAMKTQNSALNYFIEQQQFSNEVTGDMECKVLDLPKY